MVKYITAVEKQQHPEKLLACERALLLVCIPVCRLAPEASFTANMDVTISRGLWALVLVTVCILIHTYVCVTIYIERYI